MPPSRSLSTSSSVMNTEFPPKPSLELTLSRHSKSVNALSVSPDGNTLLSGGDDARLVVWNLKTGENVQDIWCTFNGPVSCIAWIASDKHHEEDVFVFGCADGTLHVYERMDHNSRFVFISLTEAHDGAVECIAYDAICNRLATVGGGLPQVWTFNNDTTLKKLDSFAPARHQFIARTVHFCDEGASIIVTYLESHQIVCFSIEPSAIKWSKQIPTRIGHAVLDDNEFLVSNLANGVDQYTLPTVARLRSFSHSIIRNVPLQVAVARGGKWLVAGGDDGFARVFDRRTGQFLHRLDHGSTGDLIQIITTHFTSDTNNLIITASTNPGPSSIKVWSFTLQSPSKQRAKTGVLRGGHRATQPSQLQTIFLVLLSTLLINLASPHLDALTSMGFWRNQLDSLHLFWSPTPAHAPTFLSPLAPPDAPVTSSVPFPIETLMNSEDELVIQPMV